MRSKWEHHYKKRIRSCNEVSITKKKNQAVQWSLHCKKKESGRVPFIDSKWSSVEVEMELRFYHTKSQWSSELYLNSIWCPTTTFQQPQALPYSRPPAPPTTTPPHHEAFLFVPCSLSPTSTLEYINNKKLHHHQPPWAPLIYTIQKMILMIVRSLRLYFYAIAATTRWIKQHSMPNLTIALTKPRLKSLI